MISSLCSLGTVHPQQRTHQEMNGGTQPAARRSSRSKPWLPARSDQPNQSAGSPAVACVARMLCGFATPHAPRSTCCCSSFPADFGFDPLGLSDPEGAGGFITPEWLSYSEVRGFELPALHVDDSCWVLARSSSHGRSPWPCTPSAGVRSTSRRRRLQARSFLSSCPRFDCSTLVPSPPPRQVIHCRWAMLGAAGFLAPEILATAGVIPASPEEAVWFRSGVIPPAGQYGAWEAAWAHPSSRAPRVQAALQHGTPCRVLRCHDGPCRPLAHNTHPSVLP